MYSFKSDYNEGAYPKILERLLETNLEQNEGYGEDRYSIEAVRLIKEKMKNEDVDIYFISGGTQTNLISIAAFLRPHEACISASSGHIYVNETGAIEATGHKVIAVPSDNGKLTAEDVLSVINSYNNVHVVTPKLVYISNSTEVGTIYSKEELEALSKVCRENNLIFYMDGARLGSALSCANNDLTLEDISKLTDAFYIGGTKNGALLGEAIVISSHRLKDGFRQIIKQRGALLAKGRVLGIQFMELFTDDLFLKIGRHMNDMADILRDEISKLGYGFIAESPSNQLFPILPNDIIEKLQERYSFIIWNKVDENNSSIRLITSWATEKKAVIDFTDYLKMLTNK